MTNYLKNRLKERTTWAAIGMAVAGGAALASPYSWMVIGAGIIGCLVPSPGNKGDGE